jgi:hypothetical protein
MEESRRRVLRGVRSSSTVKSTLKSAVESEEYNDESTLM